MKRVYSERHGSGKRATRVARSGLPAFFSRSHHLVMALAVALVALLFVVSCLLTAAGSSMNSPVTRSVRRVKAPAGPGLAPPGLWASSAILVDAESGRVLFDKNAHQKRPIASTTKIVTALVAREQLGLKDVVTISPEASRVGEQGVGLVAGETLTVEDLLWAVLVLSANDASHALAQYATGSTQSFADLMNKKASRLGAVESHFANPHGLDEPGHYSTAYDLAILGRELMKDPVLAEMVAARSHDIPAPPGQPGPRTLLSHNEILLQYQGANGIKTGYTGKAGWCLVASAARDGKALISVVLNSSHRADDTKALFDYGFSGSERVVFFEKGQKLGSSRVSAFPRRYVKVVSGRELGALTMKGSGDVFKVKVVFSKQTPRGVKKGTPLGNIECWLNNRSLEKGEAVAASTPAGTGPIAGTVAFFWYSLCWMGKIVSAPFRIF